MTKQQLPKNIQSRDILHHILRNDFCSFLKMCFGILNPTTVYKHSWHIQAICHHLELVRSGKIKRLIINMPPRSLKSLSVSVAFPAYIHGLDPSRKIIAVSYSQELSSNLHNEYRAILNYPQYQKLFPQTKISPHKDTEIETALTGRGSRFATSVGGTLTGKGGEIIILDDPQKPSEAMSETSRNKLIEWFKTTLLSRLNDKKTGAIVIVTQRLHNNDLVGELLEEPDHGWTVLSLPAIALKDELIDIAPDRVFKRKIGDLLHESREDRSVLERLSANLGTATFEAQYQQQPTPPGGELFKKEWFKYYSELPAVDPAEYQVIQSWDTASKTGPANDWSVCTTWIVHKNIYYLVDVFRKKLEYPSLLSAAVNLAEFHHPTMILVEDTGVGAGLLCDLRQAGFDVAAIVPKGNKETRASNQTAKIEGGRVRFPNDAHWLPDFETELLSFPRLKHDDQVDSMVQALAYELDDPVEVVIWKKNGQIKRI